MKSLPYDNLQFLEPAHEHDPAEVSRLTYLTPEISVRLPNEIRELIPSIGEATSIIFASFSRLYNLLGQRLERLIVLSTVDQGAPIARDVHYSEPAYFWYQKQIMTEAQYLVREAFPDWKHKAVRLERECILQRFTLDSSTNRSEAEAGFAKWFFGLKHEVEGWKRIADGVEVPSFEQAVADQALREGRHYPVDGACSTVASSPADSKMEEIEKVDSGIGLS